MLPGVPVSPLSFEGGEIKIQTGSQSLESTISEKEKMRLAIQEANQESNQDAVADELTGEIWKVLMTELKVELDLLLIRD